MNNEDRAAIEANHRAQAEILKREFVPGVFDDMSASRYHEVEAMSSSGAKKINRSPAHYLLMRTQVSTPSEAMIMGSAIHEGVLEPLTFNERVHRAPDVDRRTKAGKAAFEDFCASYAGHIILSAEAFDRCRNCVDAVWSHPAATSLLDGARCEVSAFWVDQGFGVPCKARFDALNHGGVIDLKSCGDASAETFARSIATFQYHCQAAFYFSGHEHALDATPQFFAFIAVETDAPFAVACYQLDTPSILAGMDLVNEALRRYRDALKTGTWPGYKETVERINVPRWALTKGI